MVSKAVLLMVSRAVSLMVSCTGLDLQGNKAQEMKCMVCVCLCVCVCVCVCVCLCVCVCVLTWETTQHAAALRWATGRSNSGTAYSSNSRTILFIE